MKKIIKKNPLILTKGILCIITILTGILLMSYPALGMLDPVFFISMIFYLLAFFSVTAYFIKRVKDDYELLLISFSNILIGTFMFLMQDMRASLVLGAGILFYTLLNLVIKGYYLYKFKKEKDYNWSVKLIESSIIILIGILTIFNLINEISVFTLMFGYYFITYGIINMIEPVFTYLIESGSLKELLKEIDKKGNKTTKSR